MSKPAISVVLPNYNHAHYVNTAIEKILAQTWQDFELIVVDDGSTDDSVEVIQAYVDIDPRVRLVRLVDNVGVNAAVSRAVEFAGGDYLYLAAADDRTRPTFFTRSMETFSMFPESGLCFSDPTERAEDGRVTSYPLFLADRPIGFSAEQLAEHWRRTTFHLSSNTIIFKRKAFDDLGGYGHDLGWLSDWFVNTTVALRYGVCYMPEVLTELLIRADSYSAGNLADPDRRKRIFIRALDKLAEPPFEDERQRLVSAAYLPEFSLRALAWLCFHPRHRTMLTGRVVGRILANFAWSAVRPLLSKRARRSVRRYVSAFSK
jgi:glycosyltransferase involved in cell wall biosynthesis